MVGRIPSHALTMTNGAIRTCPEVQPWLYGYDSYHEVDEAIKSHPITSTGGIEST